MASCHTYDFDGFTFAITTAFNPEGQILIDPDAPIYNLKWRAAFKTMKKEFPLLVFLQELHYDMNRDLSNERYYCEYHIESSLPKAHELSKEYSIPDNVWHFFSYCQTILDTPTAHKKKESKPTPGYVYLLQSDTGHYKIGRSKDPDNRIKTFGVKLPFEVEYIALIETEDMVKLETDLHDLYDHKRVNGEWFDLSPEDVELIKGLKS